MRDGRSAGRCLLPLPRRAPAAREWLKGGGFWATAVSAIGTLGGGAAAAAIAAMAHDGATDSRQGPLWNVARGAVIARELRDHGAAPQHGPLRAESLGDGVAGWFDAVESAGEADALADDTRVLVVHSLSVAASPAMRSKLLGTSSSSAFAESDRAICVVGPRSVSHELLDALPPQQTVLVLPPLRRTAPFTLFEATLAGDAPNASTRRVLTLLARSMDHPTAVVRDGKGTASQRLLVAMLDAAMRLAVRCGAESVDAALVDFGFDKGPFAILDDVGVAAAEAAMQATHYQKLQTQEVALSLATRALRGGGFSGRHCSQGRSMYSAPGVWNPAARALLRWEPSAADIADVVAGAMLNEACAMLADGTVARRLDADGAAMALGFPAGGVFGWAEQRGEPALRTRMTQLADSFGDTLQPSAMIGAAARNSE